MLFCKNLTKSFGTQTLFEEADFQLNPGERLGMVGRNGSGKSTLFRLIMGQETPDDGEISFPQQYRVGSLDQNIHFTQSTILDEVTQSLAPEAQHDSWKAEKLLSGLGFAPSDFTRPPDDFSGGFQIRVKLAQLLLSEPDLLLLDEPTNYLDIVSIRWLEKFLRSWKHELICISHDQAFLEQTCTHTLALHREKFKKIKGAPCQCYAQIQREETLHERTRHNQKKAAQKQEKFIQTFRAGARSAGLVQSRIKMLEKKAAPQALAPLRPIKFQFTESVFTGAKVIDGHNLSFGYQPDQDLLKKISLEIVPGDRIGIIGANGKGKSTLLRILHQEIPLQSGTLKTHINTQIGYIGQSNVDRLDPHKTILQELQSIPDTSEPIARSIAGNLLFSGNLAQKPIKVLSGGERARVNLGKVLLSPVNLLLLDEPTNHLDYESVEAFISAVEDFGGAVVLVSHNETFLRRMARKLVVFDGEEVYVYGQDYETFLAEKGFRSEQEEEEVLQKTKKSISHKSGKKERDRALRPLKRSLERLEAQILVLEKAQKDNVEQFGKADRQGNRLKMETLGIEYQELQTKLQKIWAEWNTIADEITTLEQSFSTKPLT